MVVIRGIAFLAIITIVRKVELLAEEERLAQEEVAVYAIEVVLDLGSALVPGGTTGPSILTRTVKSPPRR